MKKRILQFGFRVHGNPAEARGVPLVNCTTIPNPWRLRNDEACKAKVRAHPEFEKLVQQALKLLSVHDEIGIACQFGRHRSGAVVEEVIRRATFWVEVVKP